MTTTTSAPAWSCPIDHTPLLPQEGNFVCRAQHQYKLVRKIPRFVDSYAYTGAFGIQWNAHRKTQLDSYTGLPISETRLRRCLGPRLWDSLNGMQVLECGCGAGRFTEILLAKGASVTAVDLSDAVEATRDNFGQAENLRIAQADLRELPFCPMQYDLVIGLGLIMHTPDPEMTMEKLWAQVKPGGYLVIDHYSFSRLRYMTTTAPYLRQVLKRLPRETAFLCTDGMVNLFFPIHKAWRSHRWAVRLLSRIFPVVSYYDSFPELPDELQKQWCLLDTHNSLTGWFKHSRTRMQIHHQLERMGASDIESWMGGNGVEARARRPTTVSH